MIFVIFVVFLLAVFVRGLLGGVTRRVQFAPQHEYLRKGRQPTHRWNRDSNRKTTMVSNLHVYAGIDEKWKVRLYVVGAPAQELPPFFFQKILAG